MAYTFKHKIKAFVLITVFSLNTVIGFACSVGMDMGFNSKHHNEQATEGIVHIHADGKKHIHYEKKDHHQAKSHQYNNAKQNGKDNCCNDQVLKFEQLDKSVLYSLSIIHPFFLSEFTSTFNFDVVCPDGIPKDIKQFVRSYHPPISNIYIAIQSFRI